MQAVILAAGEGSRLRPLTKNRPKAMIPVGNKPILGYILDALRTSGVRDIIVVVGYRKEQVMAYLNGQREDVTVVEQEKQLGTGHALACAQDLVKGDFLVLPGDNWIDAASLQQIIAQPNAMLVAEHRHPSYFGVVRIEDGYITEIIEKPAHDLTHTVSTGILSLTPAVFEYLTTPKIPDAILAMVKGGIRFQAIQAEGWHDALVPWDLLAMNNLLLAGVKTHREGTIDRGVILRHGVRVGKGTVIHPHTTIYGPCVIGEDCEIGPNVTILHHVSLGHRVTVSPHTHLEQSILMDDTTIGSQCTVRNAVIGEGCTLCDHVTTVCSTTYQPVGEEVWSASFGAILGDRVSAAPFTVFEGCIVGNETTIEEGRTIRGTLPDGSVVK